MRVGILEAIGHAPDFPCIAFILIPQLHVCRRQLGRGTYSAANDVAVYGRLCIACEKRSVAYLGITVYEQKEIALGHPRHHVAVPRPPEIYRVAHKPAPRPAACFAVCRRRCHVVRGVVTNNDFIIGTRFQAQTFSLRPQISHQCGAVVIIFWYEN